MSKAHKEFYKNVSFVKGLGTLLYRLEAFSWNISKAREKLQLDKLAGKKKTLPIRQFQMIYLS